MDKVRTPSNSDMEVLLGDFSTDVERECACKQKIQNKCIHEISNNNEVTVLKIVY
jgi:hypothetical protein